MSIVAGEPWQFGDISFRREVSGDDFPQWFEEGTAYQTDSVLGGTKRYVDVGGATLAPLAMRAWADTSADRDALLALRGQERQLTGPNGDTTSAILIKATKVYRAPGENVADLEFEVTY